MTLDPHETAQQLAEARGSSARTNRFVKIATVVTCVALLAEVTWFGLSSLRQQSDFRQRLESQQANTLTLLHEVQNATDPNSPESQAAAARTQAVVTQLILCVENHADRVGALIRHAPIPPLLAGCPADSIAATATQTATGSRTATRTAAATPAHAPVPAPAPGTTVPCTHPGKQGCKR